MRKLVTLQRVSSIEPIEGADNIELAHINGWQCVIKKGEFKEGDFGFYFEIDSFVPTKKSQFSFLEKNSKDWGGKHGAIIKTMRLRKVLSQGLLLSIGLFPEIKDLKEEIDYSEDLEVYKYEKEIDAPIEDRSSTFHRLVIRFLPRSWRKSLFSVYSKFTRSSLRQGKGPRSNGGLPSFLLKSDEERIQNLFNKKDFEKNKALPFHVSIKLDGSAAYYYVKEGVFGLASRGMKRGIEDGSHFSAIAKRYNLQELLPKLGRNLQILGELMGPGIQGNKEGFTDFEFFVYNIYDFDSRIKLGIREVEEILVQLKDLGCELKQVPYLETITLEQFKTIDELSLFADGPSLNAKVREGLVFKTLNCDFSFKVISNQFLLKEK